MSAVEARPADGLASPEVDAGPRDLRRVFIESAALVALTRLLYIGVAWVATLAAGSDDGFARMWTRWDAAHFAQVARVGYLSPQADEHATAFFPGLPATERLLALPTGISYGIAGMIVACAATVVACFYLYRLAEEDYGVGSGRRAVLLLLLFPTGVFLVAPYSEALFLAGAIPAFYYARHSRWLAVAIPGAVAMGARAAGAFLFVGLAVEFLRQREFSATKLRNAVVAGAVGLLPLAAYGIYLLRAKGDPLYFFVDQREGWQREFVGPLESFRTTLRPALSSVAEGTPLNFLIAWRLELLAAAVGVAFVAWALRRREWGYAAYMGTLLAALMSSTYYLSIPRMLLSLFPICLLGAQWSRTRPRAGNVVLAGTAILSLAGAVAFTRGYWFF